jgi:hypothetical protein
MPKRSKSRIVLSENGFEVFRGNDLLWKVRYDDILSIEAYKRDELTTDLICFDVLVAGDPPITGLMHEETTGWDDFVARLEQLPGFDSEWMAKVVQPPFAESRTIIYDRPATRLKHFGTIPGAKKA